METKQSVGNYWWLKTTSPMNPSNRDISSSLAEYLENEKETEEIDEEVDIPSILEEISRLSAKSPLGPYKKDNEERSIEDIMKEAERIYMESSKSFEQLSQRSKTSPSTSRSLNSSSSSQSDVSTSKSESPDEKLEDLNKNSVEDEKYSLDFDSPSSKSVTSVTSIKEVNNSQEVFEKQIEKEKEKENSGEKENQGDEEDKKEEIIKMLLVDNKLLKEKITFLNDEVNEMKNKSSAEKTVVEMHLNLKTDLQNALETLKDTKEENTGLKVQLEQSNRTNLELRVSNDDLINSKQILERRLTELQNTLSQYQTDLRGLQSIRDKLKENETKVNKLLEMERNQIRNFKEQAEKDSKCIMDLNRQIKEMERIIARKHPDSVSSLIVASKSDENSTRKVLEERIKTLEQEASMRDTQNSKVFVDVQEKFNQMKLKYESHIDDLELHVNDLKNQLKRRPDSYDVYTQTVLPYYDEKPIKDSANISTQTIEQVEQKQKSFHKEPKEETHLLATIRGYQSDLNAKEKLLQKMHKEMEELRKTNRRLQKEREGSLKNLTEKKLYEKTHSEEKCVVDDEIKAARVDRDKMKSQLCRIEEDYQALKAKRLQDLNTLQEAHEREVSTYLANITPLREQLEVQQVAIATLQKQLTGCKEELAVVSVERDHLNNKVNSGLTSVLANGNFDKGDLNEVDGLRKKINLLEMKYEERENRLRAIVHGLAQKSISNRTCEQCSERQQQLIGYKAELDQILTTLKCLQ